MSDKTKIEWTDASWNPVTGCTHVSAGCDNCYAETIATRFAGTKAYPDGFKVTLWPDRLDQPLRWQRSRRIFVNSMSDLFHDQVPDEFIARVFAVMALASQHTFQVLTKRPGRMRSLLSSESFEAAVFAACQGRFEGYFELPLPNVWLGVSVENQYWADVRIPLLLRTPAAVRFLSCEPLLGLVDLSEWLHPTHDCMGDPDLHWVIVGGESGANARPMNPHWARSLRDQCVNAGVPYLFKQWGEWAPESLGRHHTGHPAGDLGDGLHGLFARYESRELDGLPAQLPGFTRMRRCGKRAAGRELDGRTWDEYPEVIR